MSVTEAPNSEAAEDAEGALFDVTVRVPANARLADIEQQAIEAGIAPEKVEGLMKVLRSVPQAKIGASVTRARADKAVAQFGKAGLNVEVTPVLSLSAASAAALDGTEVCPACNVRMKLTPQRQCSACGVYVDKVTGEAQNMRKVFEQEKNRLEAASTLEDQRIARANRQQQEDALRARIRKELERKYGKENAGLFAGRQGLIRALGLLVLVGAAFYGGRVSPDLFQKGPDKEAKAAADASADKLMAANKPAPTGDPDLDDPLLQAAAGKRVGGKGISLEQAVAAAQQLVPGAKALANGGPGGAGTGAAGGSGGGIGDETRLGLTVEFARQLAEMGQSQRALGLLKPIKAAATGSFAGDVRVAEIEVLGWALESQADASKPAQALIAQAAALPDAAERARALSRLGVVLRHNARLPADLSRNCFGQAAEALKAIADGNQGLAAASQWAVAMGESALADAEVGARTGAWARVKGAGQQIAELAKRSPDEASQLRLLAMAARIERLLGQEDKAHQNMEAAMVLAGKSNLVDQSAHLRAIAHLSGSLENSMLQSVMESVRKQALASRAPAERIEVLSNLALIYADAGVRAKAAELTQLAQATEGADASANAALIVRTELATARSLHAAGLYTESEASVRKLGDLLL